MDYENGGYLTPYCKSCRHWLDGSTWDFGCSNQHFNDCPHLNPVDIKEPLPKRTYVYDGSVWIFQECVQIRWTGKTTAVSKQKARANLTYQWKKEHGYSPRTKVTLPGRITIIE